jgi:hypothetical protein
MSEIGLIALPGIVTRFCRRERLTKNSELHTDVLILLVAKGHRQVPPLAAELIMRGMITRKLKLPRRVSPGKSLDRCASEHPAYPQRREFRTGFGNASITAAETQHY